MQVSDIWLEALEEPYALDISVFPRVKTVSFAEGTGLSIPLTRICVPCRSLERLDCLQLNQSNSWSDIVRWAALAPRLRTLQLRITEVGPFLQAPTLSEFRDLETLELTFSAFPVALRAFFDVFDYLKAPKVQEFAFSLDEGVGSIHNWDVCFQKLSSLFPRFDPALCRLTLRCVPRPATSTFLSAITGLSNLTYFCVDGRLFTEEVLRALTGGVADGTNARALLPRLQQLELEGYRAGSWEGMAIFLVQRCAAPYTLKKMHFIYHDNDSACVAFLQRPDIVECVHRGLDARIVEKK